MFSVACVVCVSCVVLKYSVWLHLDDKKWVSFVSATLSKPGKKYTAACLFDLMLLRIKWCHRSLQWCQPCYIFTLLCYYWIFVVFFFLCEKTVQRAPKAIRVLWSDNHQHPKIPYYSILHTHAQTREIFPPQTTAIQMGGAGQVERWITETEISGPWQLQTAITSYCYRHQEHTDINIKHSPTLGIIADKVTLKPWSTMSFSNFRNMMTPVTNKQQKTKKEKWSSYLSILAMLKYVGGVDSV